MEVTSVEKTIAAALSQVPEVETIYACHDGHSLSVFTVIGDDQDPTYDRIYSIERSLIHDLPDSLFDFNVISRRGRCLEDIMGNNTPIWRRQHCII